MKFVAIALIGAVAAKFRKGKGKREELTELIREHYSADAVKRFQGLEQELEKEAWAMDQKFIKEHPNFEEDMDKLENWMEQRYGPKLMEWM